MRYLKRYKIFENIHQAKSILKKKGIDETHPGFIELRDLLKDHLGYIGWFTTMLYDNNISLSDLKDLYQTIVNAPEIIRGLKKPLINYNDWEKLMDDIIDSKNSIKIKRIINEFPSLQKSFVDMKNDNDKSLLLRLSQMDDKENLIKKISRYKTKEELFNAINIFTGKRSKGYTNIKEQIKKSGAKLVYDSPIDNIIICEVDHPQLRKLASDSSWCILSQSTFNSYNNGLYKQYIIFLTDKTNNYRKIGVTYGLKFKTAHKLDDSFIPRDEVDKILKERGTDIDILKANREEALKDKESINRTNIKTLLQQGFTKEEIFSNKDIYSQDDIEYINYNFNKDEIKKYSLEDIHNKMELKERDINWGVSNPQYFIENKHRLLFKLTLKNLTNIYTNKEDIDKLVDLDLVDSFAKNFIKTINASSEGEYDYDKNPLKVLENSKGIMSEHGISLLTFVIKYTDINSRDYTLPEITKVINKNEFYYNEDLSKTLKEKGFKFNDEDEVLEFILKFKASYDENLTYSSEKIYMSLSKRSSQINKWLEITKDFPILKDKVKVVLEEYISRSKLSTRPGRHAILLTNKSLEIIKNTYPELYDSSVSSDKVRKAWIDIWNVIPNPSIMNDGVNRRETIDYMRNKGRDHNVITPEEVYEDFYEVLKDQNLPSGTAHSLDALSTFYLIFSLVKTNNIDKIGDLNIRWSLSFTGKVIRIALNKAHYNSRGYVSKNFEPNNDERKRLFEYLNMSIKDRLTHDVTNELFTNWELEKHKVFSLIYYLYDWGFNRYFSLVEKAKNVYNDKWKKIDGQDHVTHSVIRINYFDHIFSYLIEEKRVDDVKNIIDKIMDWEMTETEKKKIMEYVYYSIGRGAYNRDVTKKEIQDWAFKKYFTMDELKSLR